MYEIDRDRHDHDDTLLEPGGSLHVVDEDGTRRTIRIGRVESSYHHYYWDYETDRTEVQEVGVAADGSWVLVRTCADGPEVLTFAGRREVSEFLWARRDGDPAALHSLLQLGALCFNPGPVRD